MGHLSRKYFKTVKTGQMKKQMLVAPHSGKECDGNQLYHGIAEFKALSFPRLLQDGTMEYDAYDASQMSTACLCGGVGV